MKKHMLVALLLVGIVGLSGFAFQGKSELLKNPAKVVVWLLDFKLDLTDAQKKEVRGILDPFFTELKSEHKALMTKTDELIDKVKSGKLEKADITQRMEKRREFAASHQDKFAEIILKVYGVLTAEQRGKIASLIGERVAELKE